MEAILSLFAAYGIVMTAISVIMIISQWKIYKKAGYEGWESLIPIYNMYILLKIVNLPTWQLILFFIPFANIYILIKIEIELATAFGKPTSFAIVLILLPIVGYPILGFSKDCVYQGNAANMNNQNNMNNQGYQNNQGYNGQGYQNNQGNINNQSSMNNQGSMNVPGFTNNQGGMNVPGFDNNQPQSNNQGNVSIQDFMNNQPNVNQPVPDNNQNSTNIQGFAPDQNNTNTVNTSAPVFCTNCGTQLPVNATHCTNCGTPRN